MSWLSEHGRRYALQVLLWELLPRVLLLGVTETQAADRGNGLKYLADVAKVQANYARNERSIAHEGHRSSSTRASHGRALCASPRY